MFLNSKKASTRTIILAVIIIPLVAYLIHFGRKKNKESVVKAKECQDQCISDGYQGHDFQWDVFSGPECQCLGDQSDGLYDE